MEGKFITDAINMMSKEYIIVADENRKIIEVSNNVNKLFADASFPETCLEYFANARNNEILSYKKKKYRVEINHINKYYAIVFRECTKEKDLEAQIENLDILAKNYEMLFNNFGDTSMYVTDEKGITTWVGRSVAGTCGVPPEYMIGKSVYDLEEEGIFYPSVTVKVLESLTNESIIQRTAKGIEAMSMGFPLFDKNNKLVKVISFSKKITDVNINLESNDEYKADIFYPELITNSAKMLNVKDMIVTCSKVDSPIFLYGEKGIGKRAVAKCIHRMSKRSNSPFECLNVEKYSKNELMEILFGKNNFHQGMIYRAMGGTLYITNLYGLPYDVQKRLFRIIKTSTATDQNNKEISIDIRFIAGANNRVSIDDIEKNHHCKFLSFMFQALEITIPPLRDRREDIILLLKSYVDIYSKRYDGYCAFTPEAMQKLYAYDWCGNKTELKNFVRKCVLNEAQNLFDVEDLPDYIVYNQYDETDSDFVIPDDITLGEAVEKLEIYMIKKALSGNVTAKEAAEELGITQSMLTRKMQKYQLTKEL